MKKSHQPDSRMQLQIQQTYGTAILNKQTKIQVNSESIVSSYQLVLVAILVLCSLSNVKFRCDSSHSHIKSLRDSFNKAILGNDWLGLYDQGFNINQNKLQLVDYQDMQSHFADMIDSLRNFTDFDGFPQFQNRAQKNVVFRVEYRNQTFDQNIWDIDGLQHFFKQGINLRRFLLSTKHIKIAINLGDNLRITNFQILLSYTMFSKSMLQVFLQLQFKQNMDYFLNRRAFNIRTLQQIFAFLLIVSYLSKLNNLLYRNKLETIYFKQKIQKQKSQPIQSINKSLSGSIESQQYQNWNQKQKIRKNTIYWCFSLIFLNLVAIVSWKMAPMCSLLQLLPIFQNNQTTGKKYDHYNFNQNLRYALPYVMRVFIPVFIFLNGFIMYSLLMWPGQYFDDYLMGFFSYFYNNFQVGTYQIFIELKQKGDFAYMMYMVLYFYMILVGNNLYPALFCTLLQMAITEKQMEHFIRDKICQSKCPNCLEKAVSDDRAFMLDINISSPKLSPYMRPILKTPSRTHNGNNQKEIRKLKIQIQQEVRYQTHEQLIKFKMEKFYLMSKKLKQMALRVDKYNKKWKVQQIQKIQRLVLSLGNYD